MATYVSFIMGGKNESTSFYFRILSSLETVGYTKTNHLEFCDSLTDDEIKNFLQDTSKRFIEIIQKENRATEPVEYTEFTHEKSFAVKVKKVFLFKHNEVFHFLEQQILMNMKCPTPVL